jgi:hypothetical protein
MLKRKHIHNRDGVEPKCEWCFEGIACILVYESPQPFDGPSGVFLCVDCDAMSEDLIAGINILPNGVFV